MPYKTAEAAAAAILANLRTGYQCSGYPQPSSNFEKQKMDASKAAGVGKALPAPKKGRVQDGGKVI
jgi:hypothetical protein